MAIVYVHPLETCGDRMARFDRSVANVESESENVYRLVTVSRRSSIELSNFKVVSL
jgi:hypothetical protein